MKKIMIKLKSTQLKPEDFFVLLNGAVSYNLSGLCATGCPF
jgi:hypothetical protein